MSATLSVARRLKNLQVAMTEMADEMKKDVGDVPTGTMRKIAHDYAKRIEELVRVSEKGDSEAVKT